DADAAGGAAGDHDRLTARRYGPRRARSSAKGRALRVYTCNWKRETANVQGPEARNSPSSSRASAALNSVRSARDSTSIRNQPSVAPKGEGGQSEIRNRQASVPRSNSPPRQPVLPHLSLIVPPPDAAGQVLLMQF